MLGNFKKEDLRIKRTYRALTEALPKLVKMRNFERITVNDICDEAQLSRSAFYAHFQDKYDLLKYCLSLLTPTFKNMIRDCLNLEADINNYIKKHANLLTNIIEDANAETRGILIEFLVSTFDIPDTAPGSVRQNTENMILANMCAGGLLTIIEQQVRRKFPDNFKLCNHRFCTIFKNLLKACRGNGNI